MKKRMVFSFTAIVILMVTASAAAGPKFVAEPSIPEGKALVYIYCPKGYFATPDAGALANEKHVVALPQGCYFPYITTPGRIDLKASEGNRTPVKSFSRELRLSEVAGLGRESGSPGMHGLIRHLL